MPIALIPFSMPAPAEIPSHIIDALRAMDPDEAVKKGMELLMQIEAAETMVYERVDAEGQLQLQCVLGRRASDLESVLNEPNGSFAEAIIAQKSALLVMGQASADEESDLPRLLQKTLNAIEKAKKAAGKSDQEVMFGGLEGTLAQLAEAAADAQQQAEQDQEKKAEAIDKAILKEDELKVALKQEVDQGLVAIERDEDKVIITVGAGGAFASGSANLTPEAITIMERIAGVNKDSGSEITVSGHTDDVPLIFGSQYRDNWDLAAARSASVVQSLSKDDVITPERLEAISYGESRPVDSNDTATGRAKNRRIEIEINY